MPLKEKKSLDIGKSSFVLAVLYIYTGMFPTHVAIKKLKHKLVEKLNEETADSLGISRAILIHGKYKSL